MTKNKKWFIINVISDNRLFVPRFNFFRRDKMGKNKTVAKQGGFQPWAAILKNVILPIQIVISFGLGALAFVVIFLMLVGIAPRLDPTMNLLTIWGLYAIFVGIYSIMARGQIVRYEKKALIHSWTVFLASGAYGIAYYLHYFYVWLDQYEIKAVYLLNPSKVPEILGDWWQHHVDNFTNFPGVFGFVYNILNNPFNIANLTLSSESVILSFVFAFVLLGLSIAALVVAVLNVIYFTAKKKEYTL